MSIRLVSTGRTERCSLWIDNNIQHFYSALLYYTLKRCYEHHKLNSDVIKLEFINENLSSVYKSAHVLSHANTYKQPGATVVNVNLI